MTHALTTTNGSADLVRPAFAQDHIALIRQLVMQSVDRAPTDSEMQLFLMTCQRTGLDPLMRQIYCIERRQNKGGQWVSKFETQLSIDGMRLVAERTDRYEGQVGPFWCGADGEWRDVWVLDAPPIAAKVGVWKRGFREPLWAVALYSEYAQTTRDKQTGRDTPTRFWQRMPALMLAKCAESLALRKAFPHELSGLYTREEMSQAESDEAAYTVKPASEGALNEIAGLRMDLDWSKSQLATYIRSEGFDPARLTEPQALQVIDWLTIKAGEYQAAQAQGGLILSQLSEEDAIEAAITPRNGAAGVGR